MTEEELKRIDEHLRKTEEEGVKSILKYFDRIHDKLFTFNNIMIAGYFALSKLNNSISMLNILFPILNLSFLIFIEYRMMEMSRFNASVMTKSQEEIEKNGKCINKTNLYSLLTIISTLIILIRFLYNLLVK